MLAENLKIKLSQSEGLAHLDEPEMWANRLKDIDRSLILVGHLPYLGRLASLMLCEDKESNFISFKNAGVVCLKRADGVWSLNWMIIPEIIP